MSELHEALKLLAPVEWSDVPQDDLNSYLGDCFTAGELICNSLPQNPNGTAFHESKPHLSQPNVAKTHKEMHPSNTRGPALHQDHEGLQKNWGKPMKFSQASNPLNICVYKMAGHDRHGAWFARKSVHEGLGFDKFKRAMMREFPHSMTITGGPGAGAVRGLTADRRLERKEVKDVGKLEVYELSAQFPGPVTPRDFMTMLLSSDEALTQKSTANGQGERDHIPRHLMMVSKPIAHPDAPERQGFVRGHYESVEMIREIPLSKFKAESTPNSDTKRNASDISSSGSTGAGHLDHDPELNPVEWIMVTRSDPGGGIPRFLVERGTPDTMLTDVHKFFNWACGQDSIPGPDDDLEAQETTSKQVSDDANDSSSTTDPDHGKTSQIQKPAEHAAVSPSQSHIQPNQQPGGILQNITHVLEAGIAAYAPTSVSNLVHEHLHPHQMHSEAADDTSDSSSFLSADELQKVETAPEHPAILSADNLSLASQASDTSKHSRSLSRHEKDMNKLAQKRERLDQQLAKKRMAEEDKLRQSHDKDEAEASKQREKIEKELKKIEDKHRQEVTKLEQKKERETRKAEDRRRKKDDQNRLSLVARERDDFRSQIDIYKRENQLLMSQVEALQLQNNVMASRLAKMGGTEALKGIQEGFSRSRTSSMKSRESGESMARSPEKKFDSGSAL